MQRVETIFTRTSVLGRLVAFAIAGGVLAAAMVIPVVAATGVLVRNEADKFTTLSLNEATAGRGALLSAVYAVGLGVPFILAGLAYRRALGAFGVVRRHQAWVTRIGGLMLVVVGLLLVTGVWDQAVSWLQVHLVQSSEVTV